MNEQTGRASGLALGKRFMVILLPLLLAACDPATLEVSKQRQSIAATPANLENVMSNATVISRDPNPRVPQHGTQVEYHASDGAAYLWYPGNHRIVVGEWKIEAEQGSKPKKCYRYGTNTYNPVTKRRGGKWNCSNPIGGHDDFLRGNVFGLKPGPVPFVTPKHREFYPEHFYQWFGKNSSDIPYVVPRFPKAERLEQRLKEETGRS
ncbi:MAG: hypothetical protein ABJL72_15950 [Roseobacter sp.]